MAGMEYFTLGSSGLKVSRLALGTMTFGDDWGWGTDEAAAREIFDTYLEAGGNFFDTADLYTGGRSEELLGRFIAERGVRERAVIATKAAFNLDPGNPNTGGNGRGHLIRAVEGSLRRLGVEAIDLFMLHAWDRLTPVEEVLRTLDDLVASGKVRHFGLSDVPAWYAARARTLGELRGWPAPIALQLEYSLAARDIEGEFIDLATRCGMGIMAWSPLASGLLTGKYEPGTHGGARGEGRLQTVAGSGNPVFDKFTERNWRIVDTLREVAAELGAPMAQVAVAWVLNRSGVASVLVAATKATQLRETLTALDLELPAAARQRLDAVSAPDPRFPYLFFQPAMQAMLTGGATVGDKPPTYAPDRTVPGDAAD